MGKIFYTLFFCCLSLPALADVFCPNTEFVGFQKRLPIVDKPALINPNAPLFEGGKITCFISGVLRTDHNQRTRFESGEIRNIKYKIFYTDGSGTVQGDRNSTLDHEKDKNLHNWSTKCIIDGMDDSHWCYIQKRDLMIAVWKNGSTVIYVGRNHYPRSRIAVRVDKGDPFLTTENVGFNAEQIRNIMTSLKEGRQVLTRYQEWPNQFDKDIVVDLYGFNEAWELINRVFQARSQVTKR